MKYILTWKLSEGIAGDRDVASLEGSRDNCSVDGYVEVKYCSAINTNCSCKPLLARTGTDDYFLVNRETQVSASDE